MGKTFDAGFGGVRLSPDLAGSADELKQGWREWLALYNRVQVLPNTYLLETAGMLHGDYAALVPDVGASAAGVVVAGAGSDPWYPLKQLALDELHAGLDQLRDAGAPLPDHVGYELASSSGDVVAEGELAWEGVRLIVLAAHQGDMRAAWEAAGWTVVDADGPGWPGLVLDKTRREG